LKAIILSGGFGNRLLPLTNVLPKCLMPINGRPLLDYWIHLLVESGIEKIWINLHHHHDIVCKWVDSHKYREKIILDYESELLGSGGTLLKAEHFMENRPVMLIHGDNLSLLNICEFVKSHSKRPTDTEITMMTFKSPTPQSCGIVELDENQVVQAFHEKVRNPPGNLANGAVYILEPSIINFLKTFCREVIDFSTEVIPHYIIKICSYQNAFYHRDIYNFESLLAAQIEFPGCEIVDSQQANCSIDSVILKNFDLLCLNHLIENLQAELVEVEYLNHGVADISEQVKTVIIKYPSSFILNIKDNWKTILQSIVEKYPSSMQVFLYLQCPLHQIDSLEISSKELYDYLGIRSFIVPN
jgi:mannose-1-phosphate guanylyltransferase